MEPFLIFQLSGAQPFSSASQMRGVEPACRLYSLCGWHAWIGPYSAVHWHAQMRPNATSAQPHVPSSGPALPWHSNMHWISVPQYLNTTYPIQQSVWPARLPMDLDMAGGERQLMLPPLPCCQICRPLGGPAGWLTWSHRPDLVYRPRIEHYCFILLFFIVLQLQESAYVTFLLL